MRFFQKISVFAMLGVFLFSSAGIAAMISGKVTSSDASTRKLTVSTVNAATGQSVQSDVWVDASAGFSGISSFAEIKSGDSLWIEAETDSEGNLRASKISKA